jgi:hypothetical protein
VDGHVGGYVWCTIPAGREPGTEGMQAGFAAMLIGNTASFGEGKAPWDSIQRRRDSVLPGQPRVAS